MRRRLLSLLLPFCLILSGCEMLGLGGRCGDADELRVRTEHDTYRVGDDAEITIENCSGEDVFLRGVGSPEYGLEKKVDGSWEGAGGSFSLDYKRMKRVEHGGAYEVTTAVEPQAELVDSVPGTYRVVLALYDGDLPEGQRLPREARTSNAFEVTE